MTKSSFKTIKNKVIAGVLITVIVGILSIIKTNYNQFLTGIIRLWKALCAPYSLSGWIWLLVFVLALFGIINMYFFFCKKNKKADFKSYIEDNIWGIKWRWEWIGNKISNIWCFCPICDGELVYNDRPDSWTYIQHKTDFICENCNHQMKASIKGGNKNYAIDAVKREVYRKIRTNKYKKYQQS